MEIKINNNIIDIEDDGSFTIYGDEREPPFFEREDLPQLIGALEGILDHLNNKKNNETK